MFVRRCSYLLASRACIEFACSRKLLLCCHIVITWATRYSQRLQSQQDSHLFTFNCHDHSPQRAPNAAHVQYSSTGLAWARRHAVAVRPGYNWSLVRNRIYRALRRAQSYFIASELCSLGRSTLAPKAPDPSVGQLRQHARL